MLYCVFLGFVGNSLVIAVYWIDPSKNSSSVLVSALAIFDNVLLLTGLLESVLYSAFPYTGQGHWFWDYKDYFEVIAHPIFHWAQTCRYFYTFSSVKSKNYKLLHDFMELCTIWVHNSIQRELEWHNNETSISWLSVTWSLDSVLNVLCLKWIPTLRDIFL